MSGKRFRQSYKRYSQDDALFSAIVLLHYKLVKWCGLSCDVLLMVLFGASEVTIIYIKKHTLE